MQTSNTKECNNADTQENQAKTYEIKINDHNTQQTSLGIKTIKLFFKFIRECEGAGCEGTIYTQRPFFSDKWLFFRGKDKKKRGKENTTVVLFSFWDFQIDTNIDNTDKRAFVPLSHGWQER